MNYTELKDSSLKSDIDSKSDSETVKPKIIEENIWFNCAKCFRCNCKHWNVKLVSEQTIKKGLLFDTPVNINKYISIKCLCKPDNKSFHTIHAKSSYICDICRSGMSTTTIFTGDTCNIPRVDCRKCINGEIIHKQFESCTLCCGKGGIICTNCNGTTIYHEPGERWARNCHACNMTGWIYKCKGCEQGLIFKNNVSIKCTCRGENDKIIYFAQYLKWNL